MVVKRILLTSLLFTSTAHAASPIGYWKTIDDVTGKPKSIIEIVESSQHVLTGKIVKLFTDPGKVCVACTGDQHNKPIVGLVVMNQLKQNPENKNEWIGGDILDPKNGKHYHCSLKINEKGDKANVRGYMGLPLFGRSQTWLRIENKRNFTI